MLIKDIVQIIEALEAEGKPEDEILIGFYKLAIHEVLNEIECLARARGITEIRDVMVINGKKYKRGGHLFEVVEYSSNVVHIRT